MDSNHYLKTSVRSLVEFVLKAGDLYTGGFQGRDRALAGTYGHQRVQKSRPDEGYQAEVSISHLVEHDGLQLEIFGRIDGIFTNNINETGETDERNQTPIIEEIKTTTQAFHLIDENTRRLHWGQGKCYAYMYALQHDLPEICVQLTYYHLDTRAVQEQRQTFSLVELETFFLELVTAYLAWARQLIDWQAARDESIRCFDFPYAGYRPGQRDMAVAVYRAVQRQDRLFVQAPTGVGKTIAALFPAVKAVGMGLLSKLFFLTAKTPGRIVAEKALDDMRQAGLRLKSVTLTAKDKLCFCVAEGCDPEECIYARDYYGKVKDALAELFQHDAFSRNLIIETARRHQVCPFEYSLDLALWADCIICDYNYAFDPRVYLRRFFDNSSEPYLFLVDEAHNLPDRAREMFSAELEKETVLALKKTLQPHLPDLAEALQEINRALLDKRKLCPKDGQATLLEQKLPEALLKALRRFSGQAEEWLVLNQKTDFRPDLLEFYFQCQTYLRVADYFDTFYISYFERIGKTGLKARLFCLDPAPLLAVALDRSRATVFFSATLLPMNYFQQLTTGAANQPTLILPSPFPPENRRLLIHNRISTKYANRAGSYQAIAEAIDAACRAYPGNYLVYFPSYAYLAEVVEQVKQRWPERQLLIQDRGMSEVERERFLAQFSAANTETLIGFAVMGGIFGEGIDLVGDRLIGAIIVGVGLPQLCLERDLIKDYFNREGGRGFAYAYQFPGLNRVMQAAGRVIRTENDRGIILLIDERFTHGRYTSLFPADWRGFHTVRSSDDIKTRLDQFWEKQ